MPKLLQSLYDQLKQAAKDLTTLRMNDANRIKLYETAHSFLDRDASPRDNAPDELACAETFNAIYTAAFGEPFYKGNQLSTYYLRKALRESPLWKQVYIPAAGDCVISPTGFGTRKHPDNSLVIPNGHVGIIMFGGDIASNDSRAQFKGQFRTNYTLETWADRYVRRGGYPMEYYRRI